MEKYYLNWKPPFLLKKIEYILALMLLFSCVSDKQEVQDKSYILYEKNIKNQVRIEVLDALNNTLISSYGYAISPTEVLAPLPNHEDIYSVRIYPYNERRSYSVYTYKDVDLEQGLIVYHLNQPFVEFQDSIRISTQVDSSVNSLEWSEKQILIYVSTLLDAEKGYLKYQLDKGLPLFNASHQWVGMVMHEESDCFVLPIGRYEVFLKKDYTEVEGKKLMQLKEEGLYFPPNDKVKGFVIETSMGDIEIRLYDDLPEYKSNFIKLVVKDFYDSLLVHRVIPLFLMQTGSPLSRNAGPDEPCGKGGPGYDMPTQIKKKYFHKRGAVAASKPPKYANDNDESSGSQFYIVRGRIFQDKELDQLAKENNHHFTPAQRKVYAEQGGAAHLDGEFTVFGEVVRGMAVVDRITALPVNDSERPLPDVLIKDIRIVLK